MENKNFVQGRDNLACTIYVPWDCNNNCEFCTSKKMYSECKKCSFVQTQMILNKINSSPIQEVVITGGEPAYDTIKLGRMLKALPLKNVFINTTLPETKELSFIKLVNNNYNVKGVNISRHATTFEDEKLNGIAEDLYLGYIRCPIHINVVCSDIDSISAIIYRYKKISQLRMACGLGPLTICIREDFRETKSESLHTPNNKFFMLMDEHNYEMVGHNECNVCDTTTFKIEDKFFISYHKGLENTSIEYDDRIAVNDIVVFPDGTICYDWEKNKECGEKIFDEMKYKINPINYILPKPKYPFPQYISPCGCDFNINHDYKGCGTGGC